MVIGYPDDADLDAALAALRADPFVQAAFEPLQFDFSSVSLIGFGIEPEPPAGGGQYGRDDLNIDVAWQRAGGYALVGDIDSGLDVIHPALRQFSTGGQYIGGNFIPIASIDISLTPIPGSDDTNVDEAEPVPCLIRFATRRGYDSFPTESGTTPLPAPRAAAYVLTTEYKPRASWPDLLPLHLMDRSNAQGRDFLLVTTNAEIRQAHDDGYNLRNIQGYIYETCTPEPGCKPPDAQKLYRECNTVAGDCATFLESELGAFEGQATRRRIRPAAARSLAMPIRR